MLSDGKLKPSPSRAAAVHRAWQALTTSGVVLRSAERIALIEAARAAWSGGAAPGHGSSAGGLLAEVAHWLATDAGGMTGEIVADLERRGLDRFRYLEAVGVVARLANIDFYARGLGASLPAAGGADRSVPSGEIAPGVELTDGWVPATGPLVAPFTLDALPAEGEALRALHEPMYMPMVEMGDGRYEDVLTRAQIEYVAARTSYLNECFY